MDELTNLIIQSESLKSAIESLAESLRFLGMLSFVVLLAAIVITAVVVLAPTLIAIIRKTRIRKIIIITNVLSLFLFLINFILPLIVWGIIFIIALTGKKETAANVEMPAIIINTSSYKSNNQNMK